MLEEVLAVRRLGMIATHRPHEAARAIARMCTSITQRYKIDGPQTPEEIAADYVEFALNLMKFVS